MATFETTVRISGDDVQYLKDNGYSLYGFKAVEGSGKGQPTVWFKLDKKNLLGTTKITWQEQYQGYDSTSQVSDSVQIVASNTIKADLGNVIVIDDSGNLTSKSGGTSTAITFSNQAKQKFTVGINQVVNGEANILCAFPITGSGSARQITPITKIVLIFATDVINTGTVITKAISSGAFIDLTGTNSRTVDYSTDNGWSANGASWISNFDAMADMADMLIDSHSNAEKAIMEKYREVEA
jgi:hypothetical protein